MSETHKPIIRRFIEEAINKGNFSVLDEVIHPDYTYRSPDQELQGIESLKGLFTAYRVAFPNLNMQIDDLIIDGDKTVTCFTLTGLHDGDLMGIAATGKQVKVNGMILSRFEDDKIIEEWEILDQFTMFQQLGIVSLP